MRPRRIPDLREGNVNLTPLIDVVLCLVIFFMIAAKIGVAGGADPSIRLPVAQLGADLSTQSNVLILNIAPGQNGPAVTALVDRSRRSPQPIPVTDPKTGHRVLEAVLNRLHQRNPSLRIIIRGDAAMPYADLQPVLDACSRAGITSVDFAARK